jgi:hypothetical protein
VVFGALLGGIGRSYLIGAATGFNKVSSYGDVGSYDLARVLGTNGNKGSIEMTDMAALERRLKEVAPEIFLKLKKEARKIGVPARNDIRDAFSKVGPGGPLGPRRINENNSWSTRKANSRRYYDGFNTVNGDNGRLSWYNNYFSINTSAGIDVNYKSRNANRNLSKLKLGQDGELSIVRVRVKKAPLILADMAGRGEKSMYSNGRYRTQPYQIDLFGRGIVTRTHKINATNSNTFLQKLSKAKGKGSSTGSRYAYPAFIKHQPTHRKNVDKLIDMVIYETNRRTAR